MLAVLAVLSLSLGLSACAVPGDTGGAIEPGMFTAGNAEDLGFAEELAYEQLADRGSPMQVKGIQEVRTLKVNVDELGMAHARVQHMVDGIPVVGSEAIVHLDSAGTLAGYTDDLLSDVKVDTTPALTADQAIERAVVEYYDGWDVLTADPVATLEILRQDGEDHLTWRVDLQRMDDTPSQPRLYVDAHNGDLVLGYDNLRDATCSGASNYYGTVSFTCLLSSSTYYTEDSTDLVATYSWGGTTSSLYYVTSTSTTFSTTSTYYKNAVEAQYSAEKWHDYMYATHARNNIDGAGGPAYTTSHGYNFMAVTTSYSRSYANAYWDPSNEYAVFGDGDGTTMGPATALDVVGHELTHGVSGYEAGFGYTGEPGGLDESMADVFGAMTERYALGESTDTWLLGEDVWTPRTSGDAMRYMNDPADDGYSLDYYSSSAAYADPHYSSGIPNLAFYLLAKGGTHPRGKSTTTVTGIGADAAAKIWYLALSSYMTSSTSFSGARTATLSAASALYGSTSTQYAQVQDAWAAVGIGSASGGSSGGGSTSCTTTTWTGSLSKKGASSYAPTTSGTSVTVAAQTVSLTGPSTADFDIYLQKSSGSSWANVASSTGSTSTESISYSGTSGTYRVRVYSYSGTGSFTLSWCK